MTDSIPSCSRCGYKSKYNINNHIKRKNMCKPVLNNEPPTIVTAKVENTAISNTIEDDGMSDLTYIDHNRLVVVNTLQFARIRACEIDGVRIETNGQDPDNLRITINITTPTETRMYMNIPRSECIKFRDFMLNMSRQFPEDMSHKDIKTALEKMVKEKYNN